MSEKRYQVVGHFKRISGFRTWGPFTDHTEAERCVTALAGSDDELGNIEIKELEDD